MAESLITRLRQLARFLVLNNTHCFCGMRSFLRYRRALSLSIRLLSSRSAVGKGSFPLELPSDFEFVPYSITYSNRHQTVPVSSPKFFAIQNPATQEVLQVMDCASPETVSSAITDAHRVFTEGVWCLKDLAHRFLVLVRIAMLLNRHGKELAARTPQISL